MNDMSSIIVPRSDQINSDELQNGQTMTITITAVHIRGGQEQPVSMSFAGSDKFYRPCKSMCRVLVQGWGLDANQYVGKSLTLYCDPTVKFGPLAVGGIRISHMSHIDGPMTMALTATKGVKKAYKVMPLVMGKTDPGALTIDQARTDLEFATTLDELKTVWSRKSMAPHRAALQNDLDARKAALAAEGPSDNQHGESHTDEATAAKAQTITDDIVTRARNATTAAALDNLAGVLRTERDTMTPAQVEECEVAISDARAALN